MEQKTFGVVRFFANTPPVPSKQVRWISLGEFKGGSSGKDEYKEVKLLKLFTVGNYALRLLFSDGHSTGIYSWSYLRNLPKENANS